MTLPSESVGRIWSIGSRATFNIIAVVLSGSPCSHVAFVQ